MNEPSFFIRESIRYARTLSYQDCLRYLEGMVLSCGDNPEVEHLREIVVTLRQFSEKLACYEGREASRIARMEGGGFPSPASAGGREGASPSH